MIKGSHLLVLMQSDIMFCSHIYWSEWGSVPRIKRAAMDGSNIVQINRGQTGRANSLTIDYEAKRLYWVDYEINTIVSSDMNGEV